MNINGHHIRRHVLDLHFRSTDADGPRLRAAASRWQREIWMPMLEKVLDDVVPGDETITIDRLEVDIDDISPAQWNEGAEQVALERLREAVRKRLQGVVAHAGPASRRALEAVAQYLRTGCLPWWSPKEVTAAGPGAWLRSWVEDNPSNALAGEVPILMHSTATRTRLAAELKESTFWRLVRAISGDRDSSFWKREYIRCTALMQDAGLPCESFCVACRAAILAAALRMPADGIMVQQFVEELSTVLQSDARTVLETHLTQLCRKKGEQSTSPTPENDQTTEITAIIGTDAMLLQDWPTIEAAFTDETLLTHYIVGAGAVLVAPFLPTFFKGLGLVKEDRLTDAARAAALVHYLITGSDVYGEWELLLPKILCGLTPDELVPTGAVALRKEEKDEADALLSAVIEHSSILQKTSVEGLRQSFLQREGRLMEKEEGWRLLVQPAAHDVLLQHLPWSIGIIKLPWMRAPVFVDWE